jgi:hypothetical protein
MGKAGLIWVGEKFYPTAEDFMKEAQAQGISRRVSAIPRGFKLGETWVLLAHRLAVSHILPEGCSTNGEKVIHQAAIFRVFKPSAVEYVVKGTETEEELQDLTKRGITPVRDILPQEEMALPGPN